MKTLAIALFGIAGINYACPASIDELAVLAVPNKETDTDEQKALNLEAGRERALHAANQYFLQNNMIAIREKAVELIGKEYDMKPFLRIGKVDVTPVLNTAEDDGKAGTIKEYVSLADPKKKFKKDSKTQAETDTAFFARVKEEKGLTDEQLKALVQAAADAVPYDATQKRNRSGEGTKATISKKWTELAEKIIKAGNGAAAATRLAKELKRAVEIGGADRVTVLATALFESDKAQREAREKELGELAGTDAEAATVVDESK